MTTLRQVVKMVLEHEGVKGNPTTFAKSLTEALNHYGYGIHDKERCVRPWKQELGRPMTPQEEAVLLGRTSPASGAETASDPATSPEPSSS